MAMEEVFKREQWIGRGRKFRVEDLPPVVEGEWNRIMQIPLEFNHAFMNPQQSVHTLLAMKASTRVDNAKVTVHAKDCFRRGLASQCLPPDFEIRPIPPLSFVQELSEAAGQAWLDGCESFADWRNGDDLLPLWVISYWIQMGSAIEAQKRWGNASTWLIQNSKSSDSFMEAAFKIEELFHAIGWGAPVKGIKTGITMLDVALILSNNCLRTSIVDSFAELISLRASRSQFFSHVKIADSDVINQLRKWPADHSLYGDGKSCMKSLRYLFTLGSAVEKGAIKRLVIPLCVNDNHWTVFEIDMTNQVVDYGDSLGLAWPEGDYKKLRLWLGCHGLTKLRRGRRLDCTKQQDMFSCGVAVARTVEMSLFGDKKWTPASRDNVRVGYATRLIDLHLEMVCISLTLVLKTHHNFIH